MSHAAKLAEALDLLGRGGVVTATSTLVVTDDMLRRASALVRAPGSTPLATVELAVWVLYGHEVAPLREQAST